MIVILTLLTVLFEANPPVFAADNTRPAIVKMNAKIRANTSKSKIKSKGKKISLKPKKKKAIIKAKNSSAKRLALKSKKKSISIKSKNRSIQRSILKRKKAIIKAKNSSAKRLALKSKKKRVSIKSKNRSIQRSILKRKKAIVESKSRSISTSTLKTKENNAITKAIAPPPQKSSTASNVSNAETKPIEEAATEKISGRKRKPVIMKFFLAVDGENIGNILGEKTRDPEGEDKVAADELAIKLAELVDDATIQKILKQKDEKGFVSLNKISETGIKAKLKMSKLQVNLKIPSDFKKERYKSIYNHKKAKKKSKLKLAKFSSVLNGRISHSENWGIKSDTGILAPNINVLGLNIEGKFDYQKNSNSKSKWTRNYLSAVYDFRENCNRLSAGDVSTYTMDYQSIPKLWGLGFTHFASKESRTLAKDLKLEIERPSIVKIYVNDVLLKTERLYPGNYTYNDIPFQYGSNDVKIEITDDTGKVTEMTDSFFRNGALLGFGKYEYGLSFGKPEVYWNNSRYSDKNMATCFLRGGLLDSVEGNFGYQKNSVGHMDSFGLNWANFLGTFYGTYAQSSQGHDKKVKGKAKKIKYVSTNKQLGDVNINASLELEQKHKLFLPYLKSDDDLNFYTDPTDAFNNTETLSASSKSIMGCLNLSIAEFGTLRFTGSKKINANKTHEITQSVGFNKNMRFNDDKWFNDASFICDVSRTTGVKKVKSLSLGFVLRFKNTMSLNSQGSRNFYEDKSTYDFGSTLSFPRNNEVPFSGGVTKNWSSSSQGYSTDLHYDSENLKTDFSYSNFKSGSLTRISKKIAAESNLYFADGEFAISQRTLGSSGFVLVKPSKTLEEFPISLRGPVYADKGAIVDTVPYDEIKTFNVNVKNAPVGMKIHNRTFSARGEYKRGYLVKLKTEGGSCAVKGYLKYPDGTPLKNVSGYMTRLSDGRKTAFFTSKKGKFSVIGLKWGKHKMTIFGKTLEKPIIFTLKKLNKFKYQKVGTLEVHVKKKDSES